MLSLAGIPVYTEKGRKGGICLLPDFVLNKSILSENEQNEILSALQGLASVKTQTTDQVLKKMSVIFNKRSLNWMEVDFSDWSGSDDTIFYDLKTAILNNRLVTFDYYGSSNEKTHRKIEPVQLCFKSKSWYVKGFCLKRQNIRLFKLTRIKKLAVTDESYQIRDMSGILTDMDFDKHKRTIERLTLRIEPEMSYRVYDEFHEKCIDKQPDGSFILTVTWPIDNWVYGTILSFGEYIEILEPTYIREIIKEKAQGMIKKNS